MRLSSFERVSRNTAVTLCLMRGSIARCSHASSTILITKRSNDIVTNSSTSASWLSKSRTLWKVFVSAIFKIHRFIAHIVLTACLFTDVRRSDVADETLPFEFPTNGTCGPRLRTERRQGWVSPSCSLAFPGTYPPVIQTEAILAYLHPRG